MRSINLAVLINKRLVEAVYDEAPVSMVTGRPLRVKEVKLGVYA